MYKFIHLYSNQIIQSPPKAQWFIVKQLIISVPNGTVLLFIPPHLFPFISFWPFVCYAVGGSKIQRQNAKDFCFSNMIPGTVLRKFLQQCSCTPWILINCLLPSCLTAHMVHCSTIRGRKRF